MTHMQSLWESPDIGSTMPGTPRYCSTPRSSRGAHIQKQSPKNVFVIAACVCVGAMLLFNGLLMHLHPATVDTSVANAGLSLSISLKNAIKAIEDAAAAADASKRTGSSSSSSLHSVLPLGEYTAPASVREFASSVITAETHFQQAVQVLQAAGVQLDGVQQMQIDRIRMQAELYARGRLQRRRVQLETEFRQATAAAAVPAAAASNGQHLQPDTSSSSRDRRYNQGILIVAGSRDQMANAMISIIILQHVLSSALPIELVYYGAAQQDPLMMKFLQKYASSEGPEAGRLTLIDGQEKQIDLEYHYRSWGSSNGRAAGIGVADGVTGFAAKAHALAYVTSFQQVLLLDSDNLPLVDPTELFDSEPFVKHGNLFWPDFWKRMWIKEDFYTRLGQEVPWETDKGFNSAESGQVLIDRLQHVDMLEWLWWLNSHNNITYDNMHGDKDTYRLAFALANKASAYQQIKMHPRDAMAVVNGTGAVRGVTYVHQGMVQHTPDGRPAFLHRTDKAKLFPYCSGKLDSSVCQVNYFTIPLTEAQALLAMRRGLVYSSSEADIWSYPAKCRRDIPINPGRPDDPRRCALNEGLNLQPVPLIPVSDFRNVNSILHASYAVFEQIRTLLAVGQKLQDMQLREMKQQQPAGGKPEGGRPSRQSQLLISHAAATTLIGPKVGSQLL